jgi:hypothetical protein
LWLGWYSPPPASHVSVIIIIIIIIVKYIASKGQPVGYRSGLLMQYPQLHPHRQPVADQALAYHYVCRHHLDTHSAQASQWTTKANTIQAALEHTRATATVRNLGVQSSDCSSKEHILVEAL